MAVISRIQGILSPRLTSQVAESTRPSPESPPQRSEREIQAPPSPRGIDEVTVAQNQDRLRDLVQQLKKTMDQYSADPHNVAFRQDPATKNVVIEIRNSEGELLKQFPPEKVLNLHRKLDELSGIVIDRMT